MIDKIASAVNTAKGILFDLDKSSINTSVQTETLRWLLETLIEIGTKPIETKTADSAFRSVLGHTVALNEAEKARGW